MNGNDLSASRPFHVVVDPPAEGGSGYAPLRRLNLNLLYSLDAILNARTLTEAGQRVHLSQPSMSTALRRLREQFDDPLVLYAGSERALTPLAELLRPRVRWVLKESEETLGLTLTFDPARTERTVRIAAPETIELMLLTRIVPALLADAPGIRIEILPLDGAATRGFDRGADLAVVPYAARDPHCAEALLLEDWLSCMVWEGRGDVDHISADAYRAGRHIAFFDAISPVSYLDEAAREMLASRRVAVRTGRHSALPGLVIGSDLIVTASTWLLQYYASTLPLRVVPTPFVSQAEPIVVQWQPHRDREPMNRWVRDHLIDGTRRFRPSSDGYRQG